MTFDQTRDILTMLQAEYPQSFAKLDERQMRLKLELWVREFAKDDYTLVFSAVRVLMRSGRQWAPTSGEIREKMAELTAPEELSDTAVLDLVMRAASNGTYHAKEEFAKLPPAVQEIVHSPQQLREWAIMDAQTLQSVIGSFVMKSYRIGVKRAKERAALPQEIREIIAGIAERMELNDHNA